MTLRDSSVRRIGALAGLFLFLTLQVFASCDSLHKALHHDADSPGHSCTITLLAQGQIDSAVPQIICLAFVAALFFFLAPPTKAVFSSVKYLFSPGRAPPFFSSLP